MKIRKIIGTCILSLIILLIIFLVMVQILFPNTFIEAPLPKYGISTQMKHSDLKKIKEYDIEVVENFENGLSTQITYFFIGSEMNYEVSYKDYNEKTKKEYEKFNIILGDLDSYKVPKVKYHTLITNKDTKEIIVNEIVSNPKTSASYYGRWAILSRFNLKKGKYNVLVKTVESNNSLDELIIELNLKKAHHGK